MQFASTTPKSRSLKAEIGLKLDALPHNLSLYLEPPSEDVTLIECEELTAERINIFRILERLKERHKFLSAPFKEAFNNEMRLLNNVFYKPIQVSKFQMLNRRDMISHFLLRLACSMSVEKTQWFITNEVDLMRIRFGNESDDAIQTFLSENRIRPEEVGEEEKNELADGLINGNRIKAEFLKETRFFKVRFVDCRELVRTRRVLLRNGYCYVTTNDLIQFLTQKFRILLSNSMNHQRMRLSELNEDDRLLPILFNLVNSSSNAQTAFNPNGREIKPEMVDELSRQAFAPCMRFIHNRMRADHHLRHFARQQYGLFLKGCGMSLDSSIAFFRSEFTKKMDMDKFTKSYVYNIRHMYGKEGNRVDHKPMSCASIILNNPPGTNDCHGCPFKHLETTLLSQRLQTMQLSSDKIEKVVKYAADSRYDIACTRVFEYTHGMTEGALGKVITNPNEYFEFSMDIQEGKRSKTPASVTEVILSQSQTPSRAMSVASQMF